MDIDEENGMEQEQEDENDDISPRLSFLVREYLESALRNVGMTTDGNLDIKMNEYGNIMVILPPQNCPIADRPHRRTELRNVPTNYVIMNAFQCSLRCFDEMLLHRLSISQKPEEELYYMLRDQCKDYLLKRSLYKQTDECITPYISTL